MAASGSILTLIFDKQLALMVAVVVGAGVIPFIVALGLHRLTPAVPSGNPLTSVATFPRLSVASVFVVMALSGVVLALCPAVPRIQDAPRAADDWLARSGLQAVNEFGFARRFLGPGATFRRYISPDSTVPASAVDVITTPFKGVLDTFAYVQWYPSSEPVDYRSVQVQDVHSVQLRTAHNNEVLTAHSNAEAARRPESPQWYVLTWVWRVQAGFQQIIVLVSQHARAELPDPSPLTLRQAWLDPLLWIGRQQPKRTSEAEPETVELAGRIVNQIAGAAGLAGAGDDG